MEFDKLESIVTELPLYVPFKITFLDGELTLSNQGKNALLALFHTKKIELKCIHCGHNYVFDITHSIKRENSNNCNYEIHHIGAMYRDIDDEHILDCSTTFPPYDEGIICYTFRCSVKPAHYYKMYLWFSLEERNLTIIKIGQNPPTPKLKDSYSNEYKLILDKYNSFDDYSKYEESIYCGLLAGGCTYLRRVLEKMVDFKIQERGESLTKKNIHFEDKLKIVKDQFDPGIQDVIKESYTLLSKGIHELSNEEIEDFYKLIIEIINVQLESEKEKLEREKRINRIKGDISREINKRNKK